MEGEKHFYGNRNDVERLRCGMTFEVFLFA